MDKRQFIRKWREPMKCESYRESEAPMVCWCKVCCNLERIWNEIREAVKEELMRCV